MSESLSDPDRVSQAPSGQDSGHTGQFPDPIPNVFLHGTAILFAGAQRVGKTTMIAQWIKAWQRGETICGIQVPTLAEVCYIAADRAWSLHQPLFDKVGCLPFKHYALVNDRNLSVKALASVEQRAEHFLKVALDALQPARGAIIIVDPVAPFYILGSQLQSRPVAATMIQFSRLAEDLGVTFILTTHFLKQKADKGENYKRPMDRMSGSGSFSGFSVTQAWLLPPDPPNEPHYTLGWNPPFEPEASSTFSRDLFGLFTQSSALEVEAAVIDPPRLIGLRQLVTEAGEKGIRTQLLAETFCATYDVSQATFYADLKTLESRGEIERPHGVVKRRKVQ